MRVATVTKPPHGHSYTVTNILLDALSYPADEFRIAALNEIASNGDRTLIPVLEEKTLESPDGTARNEVSNSIRKFKIQRDHSDGRVAGRVDPKNRSYLTRIFHPPA